MKNRGLKILFYFTKKLNYNGIFTMGLLYSYHDYEEAYYHLRYYECKKIGLYLLSKIKGDYSKKLLKRLEKFEYDWLHPLTENDDILTEVKI